uniref:Uncharacterized protein n=1 Tax=Caenorhabditis tropicalis TaxID=1561998 RepID=A0A1I7TWA3_9PELO
MTSTHPTSIVQSPYNLHIAYGPKNWIKGIRVAPRVAVNQYHQKDRRDNNNVRSVVGTTTETAWAQLEHPPPIMHMVISFAHHPFILLSGNPNYFPDT